MRLSLTTLLSEPAHRFPERTALVCGERRYTYARLWNEVLEHAGALRGLGVGEGDRVALVAGNHVEFVRCYYAALAVGATVLPLAPMLTAEEVAHLLGDSGARVLLSQERFLETARAAGEQAGVAVHPIGPEEEPGTVAALARREPPLDRPVSRRPEDPAVVLYTSGTTGRPKGAVLTHLNLVMSATVNAFDNHPFTREETVLGCLPLFHTFGQTVALNTTFRLGGTLVLHDRFDPHAAIDLMRAEGVTVFLGVPTMYSRLAEAAADSGPASLPSPKFCISGGSALPVALLHRFEEAFGTVVYEGYGLSETSPTAATNQPEFGARAGTVGHAIWGVEVEIADPAVEDTVTLLGTGDRGEIVVRGHNVFAGYLDSPEATAAALQDGWFRTGDIGIKDESGYVSVVDRKKDLVIRGGYNVYPREVEEVLARRPDLAQVAVIGLADDELGEEVCAVVVPAAGAEVDADELVSWSRTRLAAHKYPRRVEVVADLPLGPSHKVLKRELRARLQHR
ncbi:long-chain fatty acid--CoA ligase [Nocardiopsis sp. HNM0947]|uniref:Long-chain fatty acid--CoA ligase n=1 Tax=Nocardiopsis coralli TaxID=2772213 RepID=A0ABR9P9C3_9ACTN|nr:long-chain fatty acid--CoA ligase [Nocardiopsis coralli]MBE3000432.1 long-chain fatty acid--CoA ligase [Nocardiopsis coralli]